MLRIALKGAATLGANGIRRRTLYHTMNRPRNRQSRPPQSNERYTPRGPAHPKSGTVPTVQQVVPGASVSIVLKADQATGREVQGLVKDLLTRGNHPRGIKVRLQDGRIGRVQRMGGSPAIQGGLRPSSHLDAERTFTGRGHADEVEHAQGPPSRSLADFLPKDLSDDDSNVARDGDTVLSSASVKCPICDIFEGDETAVSHHVQSHLD